MARYEGYTTNLDFTAMKSTTMVVPTTVHATVTAHTMVDGDVMGSRARAIEWNESYPLLCLALVVLAVLAMLVYMLSSARHHQPSRPDGSAYQVCRTEECLRYARLLNGSTAHDPCDDFYLHVCHGAMVAAQKHASRPPPAARNAPDRVSLLMPLLEQTIAKNVPREGEAQSALQKAAAYFVSCHEFAGTNISAVGLEQLRSLLDRGGFAWPHRSDVADAGALFARLLAASNHVGLPALVSVETSPLRLAPSALLGEHRLRLKFMGRWRFRDYYHLLASMLARPSRSKWSLRDSFTCLTALPHPLQSDSSRESFSDFEEMHSVADKHLEPYLEVGAPEALREEVITWNGTADDAERRLPESWKRALAAYLLSTGRGDTSSTGGGEAAWTLVVQPPGYLSALTSLVEAVGAQRAQLYAGWMLVQHVAPLLSAQLADLLFSGWEVGDELVHRLCLEHLDVTMGWAVLAHDAHALAAPALRQDVRHLAEHVTNLTAERLGRQEGSLSDAVSEQLFGLADLLPTEEAVNAAYAPYADMRPDAFLDNWLLAIDGRRRQQRGELAAATGASHLARLVEAPFFDLGLEWLSLAGGNDSSSACRRGLVVRLHHIAFPMYSVNVTDALRYGTLGAQFAWALLTRFSADELASAVPSETGCRSTWAGKGWLHRIRLVRELQLRALADARGSRVEQRLAGLEHLSEQALLFAVGCLLLCDGDPSEQLVALCNEPLAGDARFAEAFDCPQGSAMTGTQHACSDIQNGGT
ncbi:uncharacterized protein [Dermacentor andersoni]|uniref:uncharacterized protein n=1 Tax=Dermacentor andersoni TaxID=34620 RepID=UPI002417C72B|nr:uncharacterized protein LOC126520889 [Dermacentor andersoni]